MARTAEVITSGSLDEIYAQLDQTTLKFDKLEKSRLRLVQAQETEAAEMLAEATLILLGDREKLARKLYVKSLNVFEDRSGRFQVIETIYNVAREMLLAEEKIVKDAEVVANVEAVTTAS